MNNKKENILSGIVVPLVTPLLDSNRLDIEGLDNLIEHVISGGVSGIFVLGTTGEAQHMSYDLRKELIELTCERVHSRVPVLVGVSDTSIAESRNLTDFAKQCGASAVVATPPYYYTLSQDELYYYYNQLATGLSLPLYLYNMPGNVKINIEYPTVLKLSQHPNIIGLKDSSGNGVYFQKLLFAFNDKQFDLFVGPEEMTAETVLMGGQGGVNGGANIFPALYVKLYRAALDRDFETIQKLQPVVMDISTSIYTQGKHPSSYLMGVKGALQIKGICSGALADPYLEFGETELDVLAQHIKRIEAKLTAIIKE